MKFYADPQTAHKDIGRKMALQFEQLQHVVFARMVLKVGDRRYWEQWAKDVAVIAERQIERIQYLVENKKDQQQAFAKFLEGLQKNINPNITQQQAIEMLAQHIITQPIFEALFEGYSFVKNNAVSVAMQAMLEKLEAGSNLAAQDETLQKFYESVRKRAEGIDNAEGKQRIIIELYDKFFKAAFPKMVEQLGIVYTPVEVVDFIIRSVDDVLKQEFGRSLSDENVHILDPFTGTGTMISWSVNLKRDLTKNIEHKFESKFVTTCQYRPFVKQRLFFDRNFIERPGFNDTFFPVSNKENIAIGINGLGSSKDFFPLITKSAFDFQTLMNGLVFPLYYYEERKKNSPNLFDAAGDNEYIRRDGVSDFIFERAKKQYGTRSTGSGAISKEDIFYYVYGFLHSKEYRETFANDLKKSLPRIPLVEDVRDFWKFSKAGRVLAELHINYESVPPHPDVKVTGAESGNFIVEKMRFPTGKKAKDKPDTIIYNSHITVSNIPAKAYEYVVNGKSAIEWIMERYAITIDKASGIKNDPNDWAKEVGNPRYILDLLLSIINVSVQTVEIVEGLPKLEFEIIAKEA